MGNMAFLYVFGCLTQVIFLCVDEKQTQRLQNKKTIPKSKNNLIV